MVVTVGVVDPRPDLTLEPTRTSRGLFFGVVLVSALVPVRMVGRRSPARLATVGLMAVTAFVLTGVPEGTVSDPPLALVAAAAAVTVCALVLPGVSGSFLLSTLGLYEVTLAAASDRDLASLGAFALGATIGLASFVRVLQYCCRTTPTWCCRW